MAKFLIKYGTGAGDCDVNVDNCDDAMRFADQHCSYTQCSYYVHSEDGELLARRSWCGFTFDFDEQREIYEDVCEDDFIVFGTFGFYAPWEDADGDRLYLWD